MFSSVLETLEIVGLYNPYWVNYWPQLICVVLALLWVRTRSLKGRLNALEAPKATTTIKDNGRGMVKIEAGEFARLIRTADDNIGIKVFPPGLLRFIKPATDADIALWLILLNQIGSDYDLDECKRAITIASVMNDTYIPKELVLADVRTAQLWSRLVWDFDPTMVSELSIYSQLDATIKSTKEEIDLCRQYLISIGMLVVRAHYGDGFPSIEVMMRDFQKAEGVLSLHPEHNEVYFKSLVTAYAVRSKIAIPRCYVVCSIMTSALMRNDNINPGIHLSLIE